jgi:CHASE3 domain sensor protein
MSLANMRIARKLTLGFASLLAVFAAVAGAIFISAARVERTQAANIAAQAMLVDLEQLAAARYDQSQTARGFIIIRTERHANLYAAATKLFDETLARTRSPRPTPTPPRPRWRGSPTWPPTCSAKSAIPKSR